jgi:acetyltransferase-like isoleucine patch superfamily enzyme
MYLETHTGQWNYSTLPATVRLGADCFLENACSFSRFRSERNPGLILGDRVRVYHWTTFSVEPSGYLEVGSDSTLAGAMFWCAERIVIGRRVSISYNVVIADSDFHPRDAATRRLDAIAIRPFGDSSERPAFDCRPVVIEDGAQIGIGAIVLKGVRIGEQARVMPGAVVTRDVPPGGTVDGNPGRVTEPAGDWRRAFERHSDE